MSSSDWTARGKLKGKLGQLAGSSSSFEKALPAPRKLGQLWGSSASSEEARPAHGSVC